MNSTADDPVRLFVSDVRKSSLMEQTVLIEVRDEYCMDLMEAARYIGLPRADLWPNNERWTIPSSLSLFCSQKPEARERLVQFLSLFAEERQQEETRAHLYDRQSLSLLKPIDLCSKVILVGGRNPMSLSRGATREEKVTGFLKFASAMADPGAEIHLPGPDKAFDADAALGVVIGKRAERVSVSEALSYIAGFTLLIDITDRETFQEECKTNNNLLAKNRPRLSPLGPCIRIGSDVVFSESTELMLRVNGDVRQQFSLEDMAYGVKEMVSYWSRLILEPGDILGLGASITRPRPGRIFESPVPIKPGDALEIESPMIGLLKTRVMAS